MTIHTKLVLYKFDSKPLRTRFDEKVGFIRVYDGIRYLALFCREKL